MSLSSLCPLLGNLITYIALAENPGAPGGCEGGGGLGGGLGNDSDCDGSEGIISIFIFSQTFKTKNGILLQKLLRPTVRKKCSSDKEKLLRSLEQFIQTVKGQKLILFYKQRFISNGL